MHKLVIGVVAATMTLAACGGSSKAKSTDAGGSGATTTTSANGDTTTTVSGGGGDNGSVSDLVTKAKTANFKITYTDSDGKSQTFAQDGTGKSAIITDDSEIITDGTSTISCDGTTSSAHCTDLGAAGAGATAGFTALFTTAYAGIAGLNSALAGSHTSTDNIAGRDAKCVTYKASDVAGGALNIPGDPGLTSCVDAETGVLLKYASTINGTTKTSLVATAVGTSSAGDFTPPSTPVALPAG